jgi:hypothetical protein
MDEAFLRERVQHIRNLAEKAILPQTTPDKA